VTRTLISSKDAGKGSDTESQLKASQVIGYLIKVMMAYAVNRLAVLASLIIFFSNA
jgi:hypothetical protein